MMNAASNRKGLISRHCSVPDTWLWLAALSPIYQLAGLVAASTVAEASNEALKAMLAQEYGTEGVLDAWLTVSSYKVGRGRKALQYLLPLHQQALS